MEEINKNNLDSFLKKYELFHDAEIKDINYNINSCEIKINIKVYSNGSSQKLTITFDNVEQYKCQEIFDFDYINEAIIKYVKIKNKEYIYFATDIKDPTLYIVCDKIYYNN